MKPEAPLEISHVSVKLSLVMEFLTGRAWAVVVLAVMTAGCAVSEKNPSSNSVAADAANQFSIADSKSQIANRKSQIDIPPADDDFDLLEDELTEQMVEVADPLEPLNRMMYHVNDTLYFWVLKPVAQTYKAVAPKPVRTGVRNFFQNLTTPVRFVSCVLQGKNKSAGTELRRFALNTTTGVLGIGDPAKDKWGLEPADEDLGQTLGKWGLGNGVYIVLPLFGPSTLRDSVGLVGDQFLNPVRYVEPTETSIGISAGKMTNENSFRIGEYEDFKSAALEPYVAMREAYIQYRNKQIKE